MIRDTLKGKPIKLLLPLLTTAGLLMIWVGLAGLTGGCADTGEAPSGDQRPPLSDQLPDPAEIYFNTKDRYLLRGEALYPAPRVSGAPYPDPLPCVILLHGEQGSRLDWERSAPGFIGSLRDQGFFVLLLDVRGHLESKARYHLGEPGHQCRTALDCRGRNCGGGVCGPFEGEGEPVQSWEVIENTATWKEDQWRLVHQDLEAALGAVAWWANQGNPFDLDKIFFIGSGVTANGILRAGHRTVPVNKGVGLGEEGAGNPKDSTGVPAKLTVAGGVLISPAVAGPDGTTREEFAELAQELAAPALVVVGEEHRSALTALTAIQEGALVAGRGTGAATVEATMAPGTDLSGPQLLGEAPWLQEEIIGWLTAMGGLAR